MTQPIADNGANFDHEARMYKKLMQFNRKINCRKLAQPNKSSHAVGEQKKTKNKTNSFD